MRQDSFIFLIFIFIILGCSGGDSSKPNQEDRESEEKMTLQPKEIKTFTLNSSTSPQNSSAYYFKDSVTADERLYLLNRQTLKIHVFDWKTGNSLSQIDLEKEGPNGVGKPYSIMVKGADSIFVLDPGQFKLVVIDSKGAARKSFRLYQDAGNPKIGAGSMPQGESPMVMIGNKLYLQATPFDDWKIKRYYSDGKVGLALDLNSSKIESLIPIPESFAKRYEDDGVALTSQQAHFGQTFNTQKNQTVFNFMTENEIYVLDLKSREIKTFNAGSKLFDGSDYPKTNILSDMYKEFDFYAEHPNFPSIFFDPYQKVYIRFAATPNKARIKKVDPLATVPLFHHSAIILSENFDKLGETKLGDDHWDVGSPLVTSEGIFMKTKSDDESKLTYRRYQVSPASAD